MPSRVRGRAPLGARGVSHGGSAAWRVRNAKQKAWNVVTKLAFERRSRWASWRSSLAALRVKVRTSNSIRPNNLVSGGRHARQLRASCPSLFLPARAPAYRGGQLPLVVGVKNDAPAPVLSAGSVSATPVVTRSRSVGTRSRLELICGLAGLAAGGSVPRQASPRRVRAGGSSLVVFSLSASARAGSARG